MLEFTFRARQSELREARTLVSDTLEEQGIDSDHASTVVLVVNELIAAARECDVKTPVRLTVALPATDECPSPMRPQRRTTRQTIRHPRAAHTTPRDRVRQAKT